MAGTASHEAKDALRWDGGNDFADDRLILHERAHTQSAG